jgi:hypothetical protein
LERSSAISSSKRRKSPGRTCCAPPGGERGSLVGRLADVPASGAGALDLDPVGQPFVLQQPAHHALGGRRAADVAHAHEQDPHRRGRVRTMNPLLFPPTLIKRALDDLGAIADAARRLPMLEEQVIGRIDRVETAGLLRVDTLIEELRGLRAEMAPIQQLGAVRKGIEPLDDDMRAVRDSVDELEPLIRELSDRLEAMRQDLAPLGELADKIPGVG